MGIPEEQRSGGIHNVIRLVSVYIGRHRRGTSIAAGTALLLAIATPLFVAAADVPQGKGSMQSVPGSSPQADPIEPIGVTSENSATAQTSEDAAENNKSQTSVTVNGQSIPVPENGTYSTVTSNTSESDANHTNVTIHSTHSNSSSTSGSGDTSSHSSSVNINISNKTNSSSSD